MCWILVKEAGKKINTEYMDIAQKHNSDGYGVAWYENDIVKVYKTFDYDKFKAMCLALESHTLVIHLRYATKGTVSYDNIHPFEISTGVMFHNGTMYKAPSTAKVSDSQALADILYDCKFDKVSDVMPLIKPYVDDKINRLVFFEDNGEVTIVNEHLGIWEDGNWYSNDYHLKGKGWCREGACNVTKTTPKELPFKDDKIKAKVFVYGSLKKGLHNHHIIKDSKFLGKAETCDLWQMVSNITRTFPYVLRQDDIYGNYIKGEVYAVTAEELRRLDGLEGVPTHYKRQLVEIEYEDGVVEEVIMYIKTYVDESNYKPEMFIEEWSA